MKVVVQRVSQAKVEIDEEIVGQIDKGFMVLVGAHQDDTPEDINYVAKKVAKLRIFEDEEGKMNLSLAQVKGQVLSVSQFTLYANTRKGNRPSFIESGDPVQAKEYYQLFNDKLRQEGLHVELGEFGANMQVSLINDGPVTVIIDSKNK